MRFLKRFCLCASWVTCLPLADVPQDSQALAGLAGYLPAAGTLIGVLLAALAFLLQCAGTNTLLTGVLLALAWLALTGGIHFDGLMDTADGVGSRRSRERMLEIMMDSRVGNFGAMAGFAVMLLKIAALASLSPRLLFPALLVIPAWARWCEVFAIAAFPYLREHGMGKIWHDTTPFPAGMLSAAMWPILLSLGVTCLWPGSQTILISVFAVTTGVIAASRMNAILGGQTGDTYGATVEIAETGALLLTALVPLG